MSQPYIAAFVRLEWKPMVSLNDAVVNVPGSGVKGSGLIALVDVMSKIMEMARSTDQRRD